MGALLPFLLPLIPSVINAVESLFTKKTSTSSQDKLQATVSALQALLQQLVTSKQAPTDGNGNPVIPDPNSLVGIIETVLTQMKQSGTLGSSTTPGGQLYLIQATLVTPITK